MDNVQNCNSYINIPSSQSYRKNYLLPSVDPLSLPPPHKKPTDRPMNQFCDTRSSCISAMLSQLILVTVSAHLNYPHILVFTLLELRLTAPCPSVAPKSHADTRFGGEPFTATLKRHAISLSAAYWITVVRAMGQPSGCNRAFWFHMSTSLVVSPYNKITMFNLILDAITTLGRLSATVWCCANPIECAIYS
jgi:hypothetical protein